jgi:beta-lactamase regulating signal transducer with metallopeptidase domain
MLEELFYNVLNLSIVGSILGIAVILMRGAFGKNIKKSFFVFLWLVAFLRFSIPVSITSPLSVLNIFSASSSQAVVTNVDLAHNFIRHTENNVNAVNSEEAVTKTISNKNSKKDATDFYIGNLKNISVVEILSLIWIAGAIMLAAYGMSIYVSVCRKVNIDEVFEDNEVKEVKQKLKIRRSIRAIKNSNINSPFVMGIIKPKIILPKDLNTSDSSSKFILMHEMVHIKRSDNLVKLFSYIVLCIHWYNPVIWICYSILQKDIEESCDERVLKVFGEGAKKEYARALYEYAAKSQKHVGISFASFGETATKSRVKNILSYKKTTLITSATAVLAAVTIILGCATNPYAYAITNINATDKYGNNTLKSFENMHEIKWQYMTKKKDQISWNADINNDNKKEKINIFQNINYNEDQKSVIKLTINNSTINVDPNDREVKGAAILDINKNDNYKEIALYTPFSSDDDEVLFYRYINNKAVYIGTLPLVTDVVPGEVKGLYVNNDNILSSPQRVGLFQSHAQRKYFRFDSKKSKFFELKQPFDYLQGNLITTLKQLNMQSSLKVSKNDVTIQKGEKLKVIGTYKERWVLLKRMNGKECWFDLVEAKEWYNLFNGLILYD